MKKGAALLTILVLAGLVANAPVSMAQGSNPVQVETIPNPYLYINETNQTIIINTTYYEIIVGKTSHTVTAIYSLKDTNPPLEVNPASLPALDVIYVQNGEVYRVNWTNHQVIQRSQDLVEVDLTGQVSNGTLTLRLITGSLKPYINVVLTAPQGPTMYYLAVPVSENISGRWVQAVSYYSGETLLSQVMNVSLTSTGLGLDSIALLGLTGPNETTLSFIAGYSNLPGYQSPAEAGGLYPSQLEKNPYNSTEGYILLTAAYPGGAPLLAGVRLVLAKYDPFSILASGLEEPVKAAYPGAADDFRAVIYSKDLLSQLNRTINVIRERLTNLTEENENLTKKLSEYQGCESYWKNEVKVRDYQIDRLNSRLQREGALAVAVFLVGVILGVAGGYYVVGVQRKRIVSKRRR